MNSNKVVLAFSGGLDTSFCAVHLKEKSMEVHAITINTGGFSQDDVKRLEKHAYALGVASYKCVDVTKDYYGKILKYLIFGNVLKNNTYPLSVSAERVCQAIATAEYAKEIDAGNVAHGSTGAGNDQVRFDMIFNILLPEVTIITPIRDLKLSREEEIAFLKDHNVQMDFEKSKYSINKGIWGTSVGGKETLTSNLPLPEEAWPTKISAEKTEKITLVFEQGELKGINEMTFKHPVDAIQKLNEIAAPYGIGRDIHVGDTIIGIKGRVGFEAAAPIIIVKAHHALEKHVLTKWQIYWKDNMSTWYGNWLHEGQFLDPVMRNIEVFLQSTQEFVSGKVFVQLHKHRYVIEGIESKHDLMSAKFGTYGEMNKSWTGEDVKGFTKIFGNQAAIYYQVNNLKIESGHEE
ncbi:MAG TPA: argininosuccinate synthase domain-containing protein [Bacteroidia bacterium]|jgi:argininosuccinate synthase|nr:argininosuccinate synthase domain-containing protein [Bacteroidia bacterium]